jgi:hypothetical protein
VDFTLKPYLKYQYQPPLKGPKITEKEAFLKAINRSLSDYLYCLYPFRKRNHYFFCLKKSNLGSLKEQKGSLRARRALAMLSKPVGQWTSTFTRCLV